MNRLALLLLFVAPTAFSSEAYFSPNGGIQDQIIRRVNQAHSSIDIAMYSFTDPPIAQALVAARQRGVTIRLLRDAGQSRNKKDENVFLAAHGILIGKRRGKGRGIFHDKFAIFDHRLLETGSFNWTTNAERYNHENIIFFTDPDLIKAFQKEFEKLWTETNGKSERRLTGESVTGNPD